MSSAAPEPAPAPKESQSLVRQWWFWTIIALGIVVVILIVYVVKYSNEISSLKSAAKPAPAALQPGDQNYGLATGALQPGDQNYGVVGSTPTGFGSAVPSAPPLSPATVGPMLGIPALPSPTIRIG